MTPKNGVIPPLVSAEVVKCRVLPGPVRLSEFEYDSAGVACATILAAIGSAVEVAGCVYGKSALDGASLAAIGKIVEDRFLPCAADVGEFENGTVIVSATA